MFVCPNQAQQEPVHRTATFGHTRVNCVSFPSGRGNDDDPLRDACRAIIQADALLWRQHYSTCGNMLLKNASERIPQALMDHQGPAGRQDMIFEICRERYTHTKHLSLIHI